MTPATRSRVDSFGLPIFSFGDYMSSPIAGGPIRVAMTGFGSVGRNLATILIERPDLPIVLTAAADRSGYAIDPSGLSPQALLDAKRSGGLAGHPLGREGSLTAAELQQSRSGVLVEAASTSFENGQPGWGYVEAAFEAGLDVVLASKGPLVAHWDELYRAASHHGCRVGISATHGAPLPAIDLVAFGMTGSRLSGLRALFNSTSGLLLERMEAGASLEQALQAVSEVGVAETNPRLDIEGWDAAAKCVIVGRSLFGGSLGLAEVDRQGIENLSGDEVRGAAQAGTPVKLVARIEPGPDGPLAAVRPERLQSDDPLASLRNGALGIVYEAEPVGPMFLAAYGSGGRSTAAAVIRDVLRLRR
ncbi:MAG TPA: hypothetical protein VFB34_12600 [Chloroflexota bacterium]|nr:hypothetical protein [Chloroflexota bacterium]